MACEISSTCVRDPDAVRGELVRRYEAIRRFTEMLCEPLAPEDCVIQSMTLASPTRWHLAHTTWFFETFVLGGECPDYEPFHPTYVSLFNSYYNQVGPQFPRSQRGLLSRPTVGEVFTYRRHVDARLLRLLSDAPRNHLAAFAPMVRTGLHHEQQHQELILTDIKHVFSFNPLNPVYRERAASVSLPAPRLGWREYGEGVRWIGHDGNGFAYDNESPRHRVFLEDFSLADRLTTNGEFLAFIVDGGYTRPELWLSAGWEFACAEGWTAPLYWSRRDDAWWQFTLTGLRRVDPAEPVCHVSYFEADAFARWSGARLATEAEWEHAAEGAAVRGNFVEDGVLCPTAATRSASAQAAAQLFGDVWEWVASPYVAYPGFRAPSGALGEYNAKFMSNQYVSRGGSCVTARDHMRPTYRNFFHPEARWQFTGIRLAR